MPRKTNFRDDYLSDLFMKVVDTIGHVVIAFCLWYPFRKEYSEWIMLSQWLPDIFLYPRWMYGILTGKYVSGNNPLRVAHLALHSYVGLVLGMLLCFIAPLIGANFIFHVAWDLITHKNLPEDVR